MDLDFNYIKATEFERRNHTLESVTDATINEAISTEKFDEDFSKGYEVFTMDGVNAYISASTKDVEVTDELIKGIETELSTLNKVIVKESDNKFNTLFVRKEVVAEEAVSTEEESAE